MYKFARSFSEGALRSPARAKAQRLQSQLTCMDSSQLPHTTASSKGLDARLRALGSGRGCRRRLRRCRRSHRARGRDHQPCARLAPLPLAASSCCRRCRLCDAAAALSLQPPQLSSPEAVYSVLLQIAAGGGSQCDRQRIAV